MELLISWVHYYVWRAAESTEPVKEVEGVIK
jgi:hypothetical protein